MAAARHREIHHDTRRRGSARPVPGHEAGHEVSAAPAPPLSLLAINLTRRCNLACAHCYLDAETLRAGSSSELGTREVTALLDSVADRSTETMVVLTGGEPLVRRDLEEIVAHGSGRGLAMVIGTNATMLSARRVASLKQAGVLGVGISLDSLDAQRHDGFRGVPGAWRRTMAAIDTCRAQALSFQIHFSMTHANAEELPWVIDYCRAVGARVLNIFFLICTGRGESMSDLSAEQYERALEQILDAQAQHADLIIRPRCAPHFKRIAHQRRPDSRLNRISGSEGDGCIAGVRYCRVTPEGAVTACPYTDDEQGNIRSAAFFDIWDRGRDFQRLRAPQLLGKCGRCEYRQLCGGCRARPRAGGEDLMAADPLCRYVPAGRPLVAALLDAEGCGISWSAEAERRLDRVPGFLRPLVRKRAEAYVAGLGERVVTGEHLAVLSARRFGAAGPPGSVPASTPGVARAR